jgi:hypothetical protein
VGAVSVVVVVVELVVTGGATTTGAGTTATGAGAGIVSTIGAGAVSSTVLWYEHPVTIPTAAITAGIIAILLINCIVVTSIGYLPGEQQEAGHRRICRICGGEKR